MPRTVRSLLPRLPVLLLLGASLCAASLASCSDGDEPDRQQSELSCEVKPSQTFHDRIEPLLAQDRITTCNQCHLSGVDLTAFARETPCKTWACLLDQGLVDVDSPEDSRILGWILRASPDSELITDKVIQAEHDGFLEWIEANAACPSACSGVKCGSPEQGPTCSDGTLDDEPEVPTGPDMRGCADADLEQAFFDDVYAWRGRCYPCHFDTEPDADKEAPRWLSAIGNCATGSAVSFKRAIGLGLLDTDEPKSSLLLLKPLHTSGGGVKHGGGQKFTSNMDKTYQSFLRFITHYAECQNQAQTP